MYCKSNDLESFTIELPDNDCDIHHTCKNCGIHFNHLDGESYTTCDKCNYKKFK
ncbi:MAG: hypothetical protein ACRD32_03350 [Nitrososphaerales archaeon]